MKKRSAITKAIIALTTVKCKGEYGIWFPNVYIVGNHVAFFISAALNMCGGDGSKIETLSFEEAYELRNGKPCPREVYNQINFKIEQ